LKRLDVVRWRDGIPLIGLRARIKCWNSIIIILVLGLQGSIFGKGSMKECNQWLANAKHVRTLPLIQPDTSSAFFSLEE
jgi:hypothetical protein